MDLTSRMLGVVFLLFQCLRLVPAFITAGMLTVPLLSVVFISEQQSESETQIKP